MALTVLEPLDVRIPTWDVNNLSNRACPFCRSEKRPMLIRPDGLPISFCGKCECWFVSSLPPAASISQFYDGYFHRQRPTEMSANRASLMIENARYSSKSNWQIQTLSKTLGGLKDKRVLEVGCGLCSFLLLAQNEGAEVVGCDLSPEACEFAQEKLGIQVHYSPLESCLSIGDFDAVIMRDLIEHPTNPLDVLRVAYALLKPGGVILLQTPNGGEAGTNAEAGKEWVGFRVDLEHLQYLSPRTINSFGKNLNMSIERLSTYGFPGLIGIDTLPARQSQSAIIARYLAKRIPYLQALHKAFNTIRTKAAGTPKDPRLGSYHLFAILKKK